MHVFTIPLGDDKKGIIDRRLCNSICNIVLLSFLQFMYYYSILYIVGLHIFSLSLSLTSTTRTGYYFVNCCFLKSIPWRLTSKDTTFRVQLLSWLKRNFLVARIKCFRACWMLGQGLMHHSKGQDGAHFFW